MNQYEQVRLFAANLITGVGFYIQMQKVLPEEIPLLFTGELLFPNNDPIGLEVEAIDNIILIAQSLIRDDQVITYSA